MTTGARTAATRSSLVSLRRRLDQVEKGAALLRRKRESLVAELFDRARPAINNRLEIEQQARLAYQLLLAARVTHGEDELSTLGWPTRELRVDLEPVEVWGLQAVGLAQRPVVARSLAARGVAPAAPDATAVEAAAAFERLLEMLMAAAPDEFLMRRLGQELAHATRLVNTLEQRVSADIKHQLRSIRMTLEERERAEHVRLRMLISRRGTHARGA